MAVNDDNIKIGVSPDLSGFNKELEFKLRSLTSFDVKINGKPVLTGFKSELNKELAKIEKSRSAEIKVTPTVTTAEVNKFKSELNRKLTAGSKSAINLTLTKTETANLRKQIQTQVFNKPFTVKAEMTKTSMNALKKQMSIPINLLMPTQSEIKAIKARIMQQFGAIKIQVATTTGPASVGRNALIGSGIAKGATKEIYEHANAQRNLARDLTVLGRALTGTKGSIFSFLGATTVAQVGITALTTGVVQGTRAFIKLGITSAKSLQQVQLAFTNFLSSATLAKGLLTDLENFAAITPFDLEGVLKASRVLLGAARGVKDINEAAQEVIPTLTAVGGLGAQLGVTSEAVNRVVLALAKIRGQGKVTQRELRSIFTAFPGFSPIKAIAENIEIFGGSTQKALKAISAGAVDSETAVAALIKGMAEFPGAANALYKQSLTLAGSQETLSDRFQQVARSSVNPALTSLAQDYRSAAEIFYEQSQSVGETEGISTLVKNLSTLIQPISKLIVPFLNSFAGGLATLVPPLKTFVTDAGPAFIEVLKAGIQFLPALGTGLGALATIIKPLTPVITIFAQALQLVPAPVIALFGAMKLFGSIKGGIGGVPTVLGRVTERTKGLTKNFGAMDRAAGAAASTVKSSFDKSSKAVQSYSERINTRAYTRYVDSTIAEESRRINKLVTSDKVEQRILAERGKSYARFISGPGGLEDLNRRADSFIADKKFNITQDFSKTQGGLDSIRKSLAGVNMATIPFRDKFVAATSVIGTSISNNVGGALTKVKSSLKTAGGSIMDAFGGPAGLAFAGLTIGVGLLIQTLQKARAEASALRNEAQLIGTSLIGDTTAGTQEQRFGLIFAKIQQETQEGKKLVENLNASGTTNSDISKFLQDPKIFEERRKRLLKEAGDLSTSGDKNTLLSAELGAVVKRNTPFFFENEKKAERDFTRTGKLYKQYVDVSKETVKQQIKAAEDLNNKGLASSFKKQLKELEGGGDPTKIYLKYRKETQELAISQGKLKESALSAALGLTEETQQMKDAGGAAALASEELDGLTQSTNDLILAQDNLSADNILSSFNPTEIGALVNQFNALDELGQTDFTNNLLGQFFDVTGSTTEAKKIVEQITGFKDIALTEINAMVGEIKGAIPTLESVFAEEFTATNGGVGLATIKTRIGEQFTQIATFSKNIALVTAKGFGDVAAFLAKQGPATAGKALQDAANQLNAGNAKTVTAIRDGISGITGEIDKLDPVLRTASQKFVEEKYGINPDVLVNPNYGFVPPAQAEIDRIAQEIADKEAQIQKKVLEITNKSNEDRIVEEKNRQAALRGGRRFGVEDRDALTTNDREQLKQLKAELASLQAEQKAASASTFGEIGNAAKTSATQVQTTFAGVDISGALKPEVDAAKAQIASIASGEDSLGSQISANFAPSLLGSKGNKSVVFKSNSAFDIKAILGDILTTTATSAGKAAGDAMAKAFKDSFSTGAALSAGEAQVLSTGILKPFRTARLGINSLITALVAMGTSLGVPLTLKAIPEFHTGGVVGDRGARMHSGSIKEKEQLAVLLKGEAVLPHKTVNQMSPDMIKSLVKGDVDGFVPQYLKSKAIGGTNATPSTEATSSFQSGPWVAQFDGIRRSIDAQMLQTKRQLVSLAFETFDAAHDMSSKYAKKYDRGAGQFGTVASIAALTGSMKEIAAKMEAEKGKNNNYKTLIAFMKATGIPFDVSSTVRPGSITNDGNRSYHGFGRAVDFTGKKYGNDTKELGDIFKGFGPVEGLLAELIYAGPQAKYNIKNGKRVGKYAMADHHNHVHAALYNGGLIQGSADGIIANIGERGQSEMVLPMNNPERIMDLTTQAIRTQMLSAQGQEAMLMALVSNKASQPSMVHNGNNVGDVNVEVVVSPGEDPRLQGEIIGMRVRAALRRKF